MTASEALVHVIDDDEAIRASLTFLLESAEFNVRTYDSANAFLQALPRVHGCVVTDVRMPGVSGIELLRHMRAMKIALPVIVITGNADVPLAVEAIKMGAVDFIEKPFDDEALLAAICWALRLHEHDIRREADRGEIHTRLAALSGREREVMEYLMAGYPNRTIAFGLGISAHTVEVCRANLMTKMQAASLSEIVRMALVGGLLGPSSAPPHA